LYSDWGLVNLGINIAILQWCNGAMVQWCNGANNTNDANDANDVNKLHTDILTLIINIAVAILSIKLN
jgi:hypothetical protein